MLPYATATCGGIDFLLRRGRSDRVPVNEDSWIVCKFADDVRPLLCDSKLNGAREHGDCCTAAAIITNLSIDMSDSSFSLRKSS
jgi:hypothetical protein